MRTQLYSHNKTAYQKVIKAFETSDRTCVVHPTGTGKSYLIAAVSESYKKVLILGPNDFVIEQVQEVLGWRKEGIEYMTYQMLTFMDAVPAGYDFICLDEFHRVGAPSWGVAVDELLAQNPQAKIFGTSATPIRYLDNERNMADELFHGNVASHIGIGEAWSRNILPIPAFVVGLFNFHKTIEDAERRVSESKKLSADEKRKRIYKLSNARLGWEQSMGMPGILQRHLDPDIRRVIVFCANIERLESMHETVIGWFRVGGFRVASACTVHIGMSRKERRAAMDEFQSDEGDGVRLMFSVDMLNEGIHIPRVGAVLMLRTTASRIIYMQQMGRCLTAANTEKPVILDMVDNITTTSAVHGLQEDFMGWQQYIKVDGGDDEERRFSITDYRQSVMDVLRKLSPLELSFETWEEKLQQLMDFCEQHGRTPSRTDGEIFRKYMYLIANYRDADEMKFIIQKYGRQIMWNENNREFMEHEMREFIDTHHRAPSRWLVEDLRWYKMLKVMTKNAPEHPLVAECKQLEADRKAAQREAWYSECIAIIQEFVCTNNRLPKSTALPDGTYEPIQKWRTLCKSFADREEVIAIREKYRKKRNEAMPWQEQIALCEAYCREKGYLPFGEDAGQRLVNIWTGLKRYHASHPRVQALLAKYPKRDYNHEKKEHAIRKVEDFLANHGRLPYSRSNGTEELQALNSMVNIFEKYADEPRVAALMAHRRDVRLNSSIARIAAFVRKHDRLPRSINGEENDREVWRTLCAKHPDEPEVRALIERFGNPEPRQTRSRLSP